MKIADVVARAVIKNNNELLEEIKSRRRKDPDAGEAGGEAGQGHQYPKGTSGDPTSTLNLGHHIRLQC
jgi:hypothetical protein